MIAISEGKLIVIGLKSGKKGSKQRNYTKNEANEIKSKNFTASTGENSYTTSAILI